MRSTTNDLLTVSESAAKKAKKRLSELLLYIAISVSCTLAPLAFLIYFIVKFSLPGVISFAVTALAAIAVNLILVLKYRTSLIEYKQTIDLFLQQNEGSKALTKPDFDRFCIGFAKIMIVLLSAVVLCSIPLSVTMCIGKSFIEIIQFLGNCFTTFWGASEFNFFVYVIGTGMMAAAVGILLLLIRLISKFLN